MRNPDSHDRSSLDGGSVRLQHGARCDCAACTSERAELFETITYDDAESIGEKASYVRSHGLGGVMAWEIGGDDGTLRTAAHHHGERQAGSHAEHGARSHGGSLAEWFGPVNSSSIAGPFDPGEVDRC